MESLNRIGTDYGRLSRSQLHFERNFSANWKQTQ